MKDFNCPAPGASASKPSTNAIKENELPEKFKTWNRFRVAVIAQTGEQLPEKIYFRAGMQAYQIDREYLLARCFAELDEIATELLAYNFRDTTKDNETSHQFLWKIQNKTRLLFR